LSDLDELKSLLFGAEKQTLDSLDERVREPQTRATDIADVLPEALHLSQKNGSDLANELRVPVTDCLKKSFREAPEEFAQQINQTMEYSLSAKGWAWRIQAFRAGVPFSDFIMQRLLQYRVEQAYLISRENGLLMAHVHHEASKIKDSDAVSAMFTAIQDFVKESFSPDPNSRLETADLGEFTLWGVHGPHALMVCVIRGLPPKALRADLHAILERIHFRHSDALRSYAGDTSTILGVEDELNTALELQAQQDTDEEQKKPGKARFLFSIGALALICFIGYSIYERWHRHQQITQLTEHFDNTPGIYLGDIQYDDGKFKLQGLRDPLSAPIEKIATHAGVELEQINADFRPYQSLDSTIVFLRAQSKLAPPESITLRQSDGQLIVSGQAPHAWIEKLHAMIAADSLGLPVVTDGLISLEHQQLDQAIRDANGVHFFRSDQKEIIEGDEKHLQRYVQELKTLTDKAEEFGETLRISVINTIPAARNTDNSASQQDDVINALLAAGISEQHIIMDDQVTTFTREPQNLTPAIHLYIQRQSQ